MCSKRGVETLLGVILFLVLDLALLQNIGFSKDDGKQPKDIKNNTNYILTIQNNLISLKADDASLKEIIEEIGERMNIIVDAHIGENEKVSIEFSRLTVEEAIKRLSTNYVYLIDKENEKSKITKIVLLPKGERDLFSSTFTEKEHRAGLTKPEPDSSGTSSEPEPFKFEFDPSQVMGKQK